MASTTKDHERQLGTAKHLSKPSISSTNHHVPGRQLPNESSATVTHNLLSAAGQSQTTPNLNTSKIEIRFEEAKDIKPFLDKTAGIYEATQLGNSGKREADAIDGTSASAPKARKKRMTALDFWPDSKKGDVQSASPTITPRPGRLPPISKVADLRRSSLMTTSRLSIAPSNSNEACLEAISSRGASRLKDPSPEPSKEAHLQETTSTASLEPAAPPPGADAPSPKAKMTMGEKKRASRAKNDNLYIDAPGMPVNGVPGRAHFINLETYNSLKGDFDLQMADVIGTILHMYDFRVRDAFLGPSTHPRFKFTRVARKEKPDDVTYDLCIQRSDRLVTCGYRSCEGKWQTKFQYEMKPRGKWVAVKWTDGAQKKTKVAKIEKLAKEFGTRAFEEKVWREIEGVSINVYVSGRDRILYKLEFESG